MKQTITIKMKICHEWVCTNSSKFYQKPKIGNEESKEKINNLETISKNVLNLKCLF